MYLHSKKNRASTVILGSLFVLLFATVGNTTGASLTGIEVSNNDDHLLLYFNVVDCFTEEMKKAIDSGIATTFNFIIRIYEVRGLLWDKKIADIKVNHEVQYDSLKKVYKVRLSDRDNDTVFMKDFKRVKTWMSEISGLEVAEISALQAGVPYQIRMMVELDKIRLPFYLHNVFFFLSLWDFETDWYTVDFIY